jgi:hypothetical protein
MLYCPNPSCTRNLRKTKEPFPSDKSFSNHVQQSPECKAFVLAKQTVIDASTMQAPLKCVTMDGTAHLFKKQRLWLNPTFSTQQQYTHHTLTHSGIEYEFMDADNDNAALTDDNASLTDDNASQSGSIMHLLVMKILLRTMILLTLLKSLLRVITHALLSTSQQCIMSLMYLLDSMECPDYAFQEIMRWARKCCEAGFDFDPKCKTCLGNLTWMYNALHNAEQPDVTTPGAG